MSLDDLDTLFDGLGLLLAQSLSLLQIAQNRLLGLPLLYENVIPHFHVELAITHDADIAANGGVEWKATGFKQALLTNKYSTKLAGVRGSPEQRTLGHPHAAPALLPLEGRVGSLLKCL